MRKVTTGRGQLFYLWHPDSERAFSGYGVTLERDIREKVVDPRAVAGHLTVSTPSQDFEFTPSRVLSS